ncbi:MAG: helix-turn-helix domain-containing protein [Prevotella sp.]|nr:helix-turn-helix domain-containing protein [Prevotella sp.]
MITWIQQLFILVALLMGVAPCVAQSDYYQVKYDEEDGVPSLHVTQLLQDRDGFMWFSTWNGLCRFDGYEFHSFKTRFGDSCRMNSDRLRNIWLSEQGNIYCKVENDTFLFDTRSGKFRDLVTESDRAGAKSRLNHQTKSQANHQASSPANPAAPPYRYRGQSNGHHFAMTDRQGLHWELRDNAIYCLRPITYPARPIDHPSPVWIRCLARDREGHIWVATRDAATVRVYDARLRPIGYLRPDGRLQTSYVSFGHPVYCMTQTRDGIIWLGSKPGGLFRYDGAKQSLRSIGRLAHQAVYDIKEDHRGRLWIATLGGGLFCMDGNRVFRFMDSMRVRYIHLTPDHILLAATTDGLIVGSLDGEADRLKFRLHQRDPHRQTSLASNATMDILQDRRGRVFVSMETGGVSQLLSPNLLADTLSFRRLSMRGGWPTETILAMASPEADGQMLFVSSNQLIAYDVEQQTGRTFDSWFFHHSYHFSEVRPLRLDDGRWLIGSMEGAFTLDVKDMERNPFVPNIVLTAITVSDQAPRYAVNHLDTLFLSPSERSVTIRFAALDFSNPQRIRYEFRLGGDGERWQSLGHDHSVTLPALRPGTYELCLRSTNADGVSVNNLRRLVIIARPTFWESVWGRLLLVLMVAGLLGGTAFTILYIRRIKRKQYETLQAYLSLMEQREEPKAPVAASRRIDTEDPVIKRVVAFIESNISNSDVTVGDMADAAATSRSGLRRKLKSAMGITPQDLLGEARIKHASRLLLETDLTIAEVSYDSGFADPKYFSRCFKKSTGLSPSEYKNQRS